MDTIENTSRASQFISAAFILLWVYAAGSKIASFDSYHLEMQRQVFSSNTSAVLVYIIPMTELLAAVLLLFKKTNRMGIIFSLLLISVFTGYILLIITGYFTHVPCSCGGVISLLSWKGHLVLNMLFLTAAIIAISIKPKREVGDKE
ncbi:MauE/DoxX family redox-associated membrane protein [Pedobacter jeongneungensis]|uniref:MauE/DoxX family redox-associated membrane protein n=1 Tax=Pedobacter jeongneungensis TaxID=947309 RepID=UPI0031ED9933